MVESTLESDLSRMIAELRDRRQEHLDAIADIDGQFEHFGITAAPRKRRGRGAASPVASASKKKAKNGRRKKAKKAGTKTVGKKAAKKKVTKKKTRRTFSQTADEFVVGLLKGGNGMTTAQVNAKWRQAKRGGSADNTLGKMAKDGKLKKAKVEVGRGSSYSVA